MAKPVDCPRCGLTNPPDTLRCDCGHSFSPKGQTVTRAQEPRFSAVLLKRGTILGAVSGGWLANNLEAPWWGSVCAALVGGAIGLKLAQKLIVAGENIDRQSWPPGATRMASLAILLLALSGIWFEWRRALTVGHSSGLALAMPMLAIVAFGLLVFPDDRDRLVNGNKAVYWHGWRETPLRWRVLGGLALLAGPVNWYFLTRFR